ncbi:glycosyl transferase [Aureococcus anophagefferens]|nr:glycosyl transferase [Aureococcus anophagefferens]
MLQLSVALLRLAVASSMASYLVRDEYCGTPLTEGVDLMGAPTVASAGADLAVDAAGAVALTSEKFARYVEYVLESAGGFALRRRRGCGRDALRVRGASRLPAAGATLAAAAVRYAWSTSYGAVAVGVGGAAEARRRRGPLAEWTLPSAATSAASSSSSSASPRRWTSSSATGSPSRARCDGAAAAKLLPGGGGARAATGRVSAGAARVVHGLCEAGDAAPAVARLMVERAYAPGRDDEIYACAAPLPPPGRRRLGAAKLRWRRKRRRRARGRRCGAMSPDAARADAAAAAAVAAASAAPLSPFRLQARTPQGLGRAPRRMPTARDVALALRDVAGDRAAAADVGRRGRTRVASLFSPEAVARAIVAAVEDV